MKFTIKIINLLDILNLKNHIIYDLNINDNNIINNFLENINLNLYSSKSYNFNDYCNINIDYICKYNNLVIYKSNNYLSFNNNDFIIENNKIMNELKLFEKKFLPEINYGIQKYDIIIGNKNSIKLL